MVTKGSEIVGYHFQLRYLPNFWGVRPKNKQTKDCSCGNLSTNISTFAGWHFFLKIKLIVDQCQTLLEDKFIPAIGNYITFPKNGLSGPPMMSRPALFTVGLCILVTSGCIGHVHAAAEVCLKEQIFSLNNDRKGLKNAGVLVFF